ncbi:4Fe-4S binding protein [candidate division KSB1 bacterium]|nr:4Fe-4S binding protein [candidate division KSB1 bacterium]
MHKLRRPIQIFVFLLIIAIPLINFYGIKLQQKDDYAIKDSWIYSEIHSFFEGYDRSEAVELTHKVKGSVWSMDIMGFKVSDPLAFIESTTITMYLYLPLLMSIIIPVVLTVILGKVYCGWICPMNLILEFNDKIRSLLNKIGYNSRDIRFSKNTKYFVLVFGLILAIFAGRPLLALIYPPAVISREIFYRVYNGVWGVGVTLIGFILFFELVFSRRWWCRYICPGGAVYTLLSHFRLLRIKLNKSQCDLCGDCIPVCPYDLKPMTKKLTAGCDQCGLCISVCKPGALKYTLSTNNNYRNSTLQQRKTIVASNGIYKKRITEKQEVVKDFLINEKSPKNNMVVEK